MSHFQRILLVAIITFQGILLACNQAPSKTQQVWDRLGIEAYPGAQIAAEDNHLDILVGGQTVDTGKFETNDSVNQVLNFYKAKYPKAMVQQSSEEANLLIPRDSTAVAITILRRESKTVILVSIKALKSK